MRQSDRVQLDRFGQPGDRVRAGRRRHGGQLDELHLWVFPFIAGSGEPRLPGITTTHLDLATMSEVGNGVVVLTYVPKQ